MADTKTSALPAQTTPDLTSVYVIGVDTSGTPQTVRIPLSFFQTLAGGSQPSTSAANFTLSILAPADNATISGVVPVRFQAPAMLNVELKDARGVLLFRGTPGSDGICTGSFNVNLLQPGAQTLTAKAYDVAAGGTATHTATDTVDVTAVTSNTTTTPSALTEPTPISGLNYRLVKNLTFGTARSGNDSTVADLTTLLTEFDPRLWYYAATNTANYSLQTDALRLLLTRSGATVHEATMATKTWRGKFGYFEARFKCQNVTGAWPGFWLYPNNTDAAAGTNGGEAFRSEIDIVEIFNNGGTAPGGGSDTFYSSNRAVFSTHYDSVANSNAHTLRDQATSTVDTTAYVKYGLLWLSDGTVKWYVNDSLVTTKTMTWQDAPANAIFDLWSGAGGDQSGGYGGTQVADGSSVQMDIDYLRIWQL